MNLMKRISITSTVKTLFIICLIIIIFSLKNCDSCYSLPVMMIKFFISGMIIFIGSIYFTKLYLKTEKVIHDIEALPLLETDEAVGGIPFSCEGIISADEDKILYSPYTNLPCVYYHSIKEEYRREGKNKRWVVVENQVNFIPFYIADKRGKLKVDLTNMDNDFSGYQLGGKYEMVYDPKFSEVDCDAVMKHQAYDENKTVLGFVSLSTTLRRNEFILAPNTRVFVYGYVSKFASGLILREHPLHPLLISKKTKDMYIEEFYKGKNLVFFIHVLLSIGFTVSLLSLNYFMLLDSNLLIIILFFGNLCISGSIVFTMYNRIFTLRERTLCALSSIDIELKRRADLIPQIVELVKGYSGYEKEIFQIIAFLRSRILYQKDLLDAKKPDFSPLFAIIENYPEIKASDNYQQLVKTLVDTEERIAYSRTFYNRNVRKLNTLIDQFPFIIISIIFNIKKMDFITIIPDKDKAV